MKNVNGKGIVLRIADVIRGSYVVVRDNSKKILAPIGAAVIAFTGCGRRVVNPAKPGSGNFEKDTGNSSSVSDTNPNETTITEDTTTYVVEEDGTTKYYVSDEWGTSYIESQDVVTSGLHSSSSNGRKTTKTTPVLDVTTENTDEEAKTTDHTDAATNEKTDNTTGIHYTSSDSKTTTSKTTTNTTRGTVTTSKTTTSKTTTTTTKKNNSSEPEIDGYKLSEVLSVSRAFGKFSSKLRMDIGKVKGQMFEFPGLRFSYGATGGVYESSFLFMLLNSDYLSYFDASVLDKIFSNFEHEHLVNAKEFCSKYKYITTKLGTSTDFTQYTLDHDLGVLLNSIVDSYDNGTLKQLVIPNKYKDNVAILNLLYSYGIITDYSYMDPFLDEFSDKVFGSSFTEKPKMYTK